MWVLVMSAIFNGSASLTVVNTYDSLEQCDKALEIRLASDTNAAYSCMLTMQLEEGEKN